MSMPLAPGRGLTRRNSLNTTVYTSMIARGYASDQAQPRNDRLYLDRSSRSARLAKSSFCDR